MITPAVRTGLAIASALIAVTATPGCGGNDKQSSGGKNDPIIIGAAIAKSGTMSTFDTPMLGGLRVAIKKVNADGGIDGRPVKLVTADHKSNLEQVQQSALDVMEKGADVVITTHDFDFGSPAARVANAKGLLALGGAGGMSYGRQGIGPLTFNLYPGNVTEGGVMAQFASDQGYKQPFLFQDLSIQYTKEVCDFFGKAFDELGAGSPAGTAKFQNDDTSFASQINKLRSSNADSIVLCSYPPGGAAIIRQLRAAGIDLPIVASGGGMDGTSWLKAVPGLTGYYDSVAGSLTGDDPRPEVNSMFKDIERESGKQPQLAAQALTGYSAVEMVKRAVESSGGKTDGKTLAKKIESFKGEKFLLGPVTYNAECHIPVGTPMHIRQVKAGKSSYLKEVTPSKVPASPC